MKSFILSSSITLLGFFLIGSVQAVTVCTGAPANGDCTGVCTTINIGTGQTIYTPGTNCVRNPKTIPIFNAWVCNNSGGYIRYGPCSELSTLPQSGKDNYVWWTPGTNSMTRFSS